MAKIIDRINQEFREALEKMSDGDNSPQAIMEIVNKRFLAEGCYLLMIVFVKIAFVETVVDGRILCVYF